VAEEQVQALLADIAAQAEADRARILEDRHKRLEEIAERIEKETRSLEAEASRRLEQSLRVEQDRIEGRMLQERRSALLAVRREWLERAFTGAERRIAELCTGQSYPWALRSLIVQALEAIGEAGELAVTRRDVELARTLVRELAPGCAIRGEGEEAGTVRASSPDGLRRVDNSLSSRLRRARLAMEPEISRLLFGEEAQEHA
jgi:vacuolar-type H+-ATPase subunit E/Vma4